MHIEYMRAGKATRFGLDFQTLRKQRLLKRKWPEMALIWRSKTCSGLGELSWGLQGNQGLKPEEDRDPLPGVNIRDSKNHRIGGQTKPVPMAAAGVQAFARLGCI